MGFKYFFQSPPDSSDDIFENRFNEFYHDVCLTANSLERRMVECESGVDTSSKLVNLQDLQQSIKKLKCEIANHSSNEEELNVRTKEHKLAVLRKEFEDETNRSALLKKKCGILLDSCCSIESERASLAYKTRQKHNAFLNVIKYYSTLLNCRIVPHSDNVYQFHFLNSNVAIRLRKKEDHMEVVGFQPKLNIENDICQHVKETKDFQGLASLFHSISQ
nr:PREDICTED: uncharacterized protein LOC109036635 [Bemisia tabaci]XP_018906527.1 PREDICTED: uncharacterized protein LOC109036635 [Bemisia tabaci]